ncbi:MAG: hypothetical protein P9C36_13085 [Defluviicoccus sp.]|nr:hypothetical protein [Defluviicoccus sp.]MDG4593550.1 hypothetical protein [Defluviicoccus sp.]
MDAADEQKAVADQKIVDCFRQILFWPLQLMQIRPSPLSPERWTLLENARPSCPWQPEPEAFSPNPEQFRERHYIEFITFLPYVQRLLYGEGGGPQATLHGRSPIRVFRRRDVTHAQLVFPGDDAVLRLEVARCELLFFYDLDIVILVVETRGDGLTLQRAQEVMFRFGRAYPHFWHADGRPSNCMKRVAWLAADGSELAASDYECRERYLRFVSSHRAPCIASHWEFLLDPLVPHYSDKQGPLRVRQLEYHRMPLMAYLAVDDMQKLTRADFIRLGLVTHPGDSTALPFASGYLDDFERRFCYDRFHDSRASRLASDTRLMCCGHAFVMVGNNGYPFFGDTETGLAAQFDHPYFVLGLVAHMHKATLLMLRDRLNGAVNQLDLGNVNSIKAFKRSIRNTMEVFLRFTHRYWFREISIQVQARDLFHLWRNHLSTEELYTEVRQEVHDMSTYLDSDGLRRQADTVLRLTVVTVFGLIGTFASGILGMNIFDETGHPPLVKLLIFLVVAVPATLLILYTVTKSKPLSDFLDALSDERIGLPAKFAALADVWRRRVRASPGAGDRDGA